MGGVLDNGVRVSEVVSVVIGVCKFNIFPFLAFAQILKLYEKFRFLNIKFGLLLHEFLNKTASLVGRNQSISPDQF